MNYKWWRILLDWTNPPAVDLVASSVLQFEPVVPVGHIHRHVLPELKQVPPDQHGDERQTSSPAISGYAHVLPLIG